jgi:hypothetical protein
MGRAAPRPLRAGVRIALLSRWLRPGRTSCPLGRSPADTRIPDAVWGLGMLGPPSIRTDGALIEARAQLIYDQVSRSR